MKYSSLLCLSFLATLAACQSESGSGSNSKKEVLPQTQSGPTANAESNTHTSLKVSKRRIVSLNKNFTKSDFIAFKENINKYLVTLEAETGSFLGAQAECQVSSHLTPLDDKKYASFNDVGLKAEVELELQSEGPINVDYRCRVIDRGIEVDSVTVSLKKSILVNNKQNIYALGLDGNQSIEALVLDEGAVLTTEGDKIGLTMNELISNGGTIATFTRDNMPVPLENEPGKSGGIINITTKRAIGDILFELRGGNAGAQTKIPEKNPYIHPKYLSLDGECKGHVDADSSYKNNMKCRGKKGAQGAPGFKGLSGYDGGSTGLVVLKTQKSQDFRWGVSYFPGKESVGSVGGKGGAPGAGGIGSTVEVYKERNEPPRPRLTSSLSSKSYKYADGPIGDEGVQGEMGDSGKSGEKQNSQILVDSEGAKYEFNFDFKNY